MALFANCAQALVFLQGNGSQHLLVIEAENYSLNTNASAKDWVSDLTADYSGEGAMVTAPNSGSLIKKNNAVNADIDREIVVATGRSDTRWR